MIRPDVLGPALPILIGFAVAVILFEGGMNLKISRLRHSQDSIRRLIVFDGLVTTAGAAAATHLIGLFFDLLLPVVRHRQGVDQHRPVSAGSRRHDLLCIDAPTCPCIVPRRFPPVPVARPFFQESAMPTIIRRLLPLLACLALLLPAPRSAAAKSAEQLTVLATTFPMYLFTRGVVAGRDRVRVDLMIPAQMGCPHDYALTPQDMRRLAAADVLVINGLGLEEFLGAPLARANPDLRVIDSSAGVDDLLPLTAAAPPGPRVKDHDHDHAHAGAARAVNPHLFASPRQAARLVATIAGELAKIDPEGAPLYQANGHALGERLHRLADEFSSLAGRLGNTRIVTQHGVFDYLARDTGLAIVAVVQAHAGQEPSAAEMLAIVRTIREHGAGALFTEPQYPAAIGRTIAAEADIPAATLDPAATGPEQPPADYYEQAMRANLATLERTLGRR